ncbi:MAG TPA: PD-(D/E)XK nuclease family protein [Solirubrobacteraceae bacterium]|jgi:ATP-dependent helicase/DNAse subunit B
MPLTLVLGPANSAKAGEVLGAYSAAARRGALLVVPTSLDARHYTRELAGAGAVLGSVLTFGELAREIARRAEYPGRRLSTLQRERVLERVLSRIELPALSASAGAPGFLAAAGELIAELQRGLVTPQRFAAALSRWAAEDVRRQLYARDVAHVYGEYARELDRLGRVDSELYAWRALDALRSAPGRWGQDQVFFYGFDELTALERDAVETLSRIAGAEVTVSLTYEPGREALHSRAEAVEELRPLATRVLELPALDDHYAEGARAALHHVERSLFEAGAERLDPGSAVSLLEAGGERAEAELVAAKVLELLRAGVPGQEIVVVHRSLSHAGPLLARVLEQYGVAVAGAQEVALAHTPLGRAVLGAARCALLDERAARPEDLLDYLRAPGVLQRPELADGLEAEVRRQGLTTAAQARERLGWSLLELDEVSAATDPLAKLCELAKRLFAAPHRGAAAVLSGPEQLDARALATLERARSELSELGLAPDGPRLVELLEGLTVRPAQTDAPCAVLLAEPLQIRARRFRAVLVCGLQEGAFPLPGRPEPFLSDERRWELAACSGLRLRPHEDSLARERYLFYAAVSRATERVFVSYRSSDEEGNLALPSPFIADLAELLVDDWPQRRERRLLADVIWPPELAPTAYELQRSLAAVGAPVAGDEPVAERALGSEALATLRHTRILSAGALEAYGDCPMRWLIERELRPEPLEPESEPIARGNLMHDLLERLLRRLDGPVTQDSLQRARMILDELLAELGPAGPRLAPGRPGVVAAAALRAIEADLRRYLDHEAAGGGDWRPEGLELRFGFEPGEDGADGPARESLPPLELGEGHERVLVRGMIDRVDVDRQGQAVVRDYKSGAGRPEHQGARWSLDRRLQVALYMLVARELLGREPVAGFYQPLRGDDLRARGLFVKGIDFGPSVVPNDGRQAEELQSELEDAADRAVALATALRAGELTPCPQTCSRDGCAYPGICRSQ